MEEDTSQSIGTAREKFWKELTVEEKLERLREFTKSNLEQLAYASQQQEERLSGLVVAFSQHKHDGTTGSPILPVGVVRHLGMGEYRPERGRELRKRENQNPDEVYI